MNKILYLNLLLLIGFLQACSIGSPVGYCESTWFSKVDFSFNKCNYRKAGVCEDSLKILKHRKETLDKSYEGFECN